MGWVYRSTSANTGCEGFVRSPTKRTFARFLPYMSPELLNCRVFGVSDRERYGGSASGLRA